ncbi:MAG: methyl-accepting chemotaxis protein [Gammaproteobacteria bacterium]|nr:methyl-accepting chemotaxis protein [Gammaproteobacteria bacterium]
MAVIDKIKDLLPGNSSGPTRSSGQSGGGYNKKAVMVGVLLILSLLAMVAMFSIESRRAHNNRLYITIASQQQVISQQITVNALEAAAGQDPAFDRLAANQNRFLGTLDKYNTGDHAQDLPALPEDFSVEYSNLKAIWNDYDRHIATVVAAKVSIATVSDYVTQINESLPELMSLSDRVVNDLVKSRAPRKNIAIAARQVILIRSIEHSLNQILNDGEVVMAAADRFATDATQIEMQLLGMLEGDDSLGIAKFTEPDVVGNLLQFADLYSVVRKNVREILDNSAQIFKVHEAASKIDELSPLLLTASEDLIKSIERHDDTGKIFILIGYGFALFAGLLLLLLIVIIARGSQSSLAESQEQNEKNQRAILRLLDEMTNLADGDLSTHTTVTEDITGAIADSVNYSIDALRDLVGTINNTANQVRSAVRKTQNMTGELAEASEAQASQITTASSAVTEISKSMSQVSERAADSAEVARKSVSIAHKGGETVRQTIGGMETIREQIQETSKRIKRLGESSQEIGDIVNLITEISDQTNILALNAAIQASMAGEAGRGFAVVADEVQRLAERTGDATKQIEALVKTIQADTNEATVSMEQSTANVVKGAKLTENAGSALDRIEQVSMNLAQRILEISDSTRDQAQDSVKITETMDVIQEITAKTSEGSNKASGSIGELSDMVKEMQTSVAGFKLPGVGSAQSTIVQDPEDLAALGLAPEAPEAAE